MRGIFVSSLCLALAACATAEPVPTARPLSQASIEAMGPTRASVTANQTGVTKSWYYTQVNGAGAGIAGAIGGAIAAAIINAAPAARANRQASELAEDVTPPELDQSLVTKMRAQVTPPRDKAVTLSEVVLTPEFVKPVEIDDAVEVVTTYTLSEDSSVLRVVSTATYKNAALPYRTPYTFKKSAPASEKTGPLYRNTFTYYSTPLPVPTLTPELKQRLVASAQESARAPDGSLPAADTREYKTMQHEIELAQDDKLTGGETSVFLTREWLKEDGAPLMREVEKAHAFVAKYLVVDLNRTAVPSLEGTDELLETSADDRTVRRIGAGVEAGSYVSSAANVVAPATYGNTVAVGKATANYFSEQKRQAKPAK